MNFIRWAFARGAAVAILAAAVIGLPQAASAQTALAGTWNFVPARSTATPGPLPYKSAKITFNGEDMTLEGVDADGDPVKISYNAAVDGKPHPVTGAPQYDTVTLTKFSDQRASYAFIKGKSNVRLGVRVLAADGNSITFAEKIYNNAGKELAAHQMVFAKPGFEVATVTPPPAPRQTAAAGAGNTPDENAGSAALAAGNDDEAIRLYSAAIDSNNPQVNLSYDYVARGIAYARKNQNDEAMKDFDAAIKLKPEDPEAHFRRGGILVGLKKYDDAIKDLDVAIKGDDMNATAYYLRGFSYLSLTKDVPGAADKDKACMLDMKYCM